VEKVGSDERRLGVISENVGVISLRCGNALSLFNILQRPQQIAVAAACSNSSFSAPPPCALPDS